MSGFGGIFAGGVAAYGRGQREAQQEEQKRQQAALQQSLINWQIEHGKAEEARAAHAASPEGQQAAMERQITIAKRLAELQQVKNPVDWKIVQRADGSTVQLNPETGETREVMVNGQPLKGAAPATPNIDPLSKAGIAARLKLLQAENAAKQAGGGSGVTSEGERRATALMPRAEASDSILDKTPTPGLLRRSVAKIPFVGNSLASSGMQQYENAGDQFITAILRPESGATITEDEMETARRMYVPLPGDSPELLKQKEAARTRAIEQLRTMGGRAAPMTPTGPAAPPPPRYRENPF